MTTALSGCSFAIALILLASSLSTTAFAVHVVLAVLLFFGILIEEALA